MGRILALTLIAAILTAAVILAQGQVARLDGYEEDEYEYEEDEAEEAAEALGSLAWNLGVPLIVGYVAYKHFYLWAAKRGLRLPLSLATALRVHVASSLVLAAAALAHALLLADSAGPLEYAAAGLVALVTLSGAVLYFARRRGRATLYARLIHGQRTLALLTLIVVALHVALA